MNVISIGTDRKLFEEGSAVRQRMVAYGNRVGEMHIIVFTVRGYTPQQLAHNVWVYPTNSRSKFFYIQDARRVAATCIRQKKYTAADTIVSVQDPFETGLVGIFLKKRFGMRLQVQVHTDFLSPYFWRHSVLNFLRSFIAWRVVPRADTVRVVSQRIARSLVEHFPDIDRTKISVLPIYTDATRFQAIAATSTDKYPQFSDVILMVSRLAPEKNIALAIRVFKKILADFPTVGLVIVGDGPEKKRLQRLCAKLGLGEAVVFEPWTNDVAPYYAAANIFLSTSLYEGYGLTLLEAAAAGKTIVTSDVGIAGDVLRDNVSARVCRVANEDDFEKTLSELLAAPETCQRLGVAAGAAVTQGLISNERYLEEYKTLFEQTLHVEKIKRLLIVTQSVNLDNPVLGFFHRWIEAFAEHFETVTVICLEEGRHALPANVTIRSLGKENGRSRWKYIRRFFYYIRHEREKYDAVLVHMNPIYVVLGGLLWKQWRKKIALWYVHRHVSITLRLATRIANSVFTATPQSFRIASKKVHYLGQAVDVAAFIRPHTSVAQHHHRHHHSLHLVSVGRVTPIKNLDTIIDAVALLKKRGNMVALDLVGEATYPADTIYKKKLEQQISALNLTKEIRWVGAIASTKIAEQYWHADISINAAPSGGQDKAVLESMAAGTPVLTSNPAFKEVLGPYSQILMFRERDAEDLALKISALHEYKDIRTLTEELQNTVRTQANITGLIDTISNELRKL